MLILDELDSIAPARSGPDGNGDEVGRRLLGTLLNEMDGVGHASSSGGRAIQLDRKSRRGKDGVIFVGCSNRRDAIDPAVRHTGRDVTLAPPVCFGLLCCASSVHAFQAQKALICHGCTSCDQQHASCRYFDLAALTSTSRFRCLISGTK